MLYLAFLLGPKRKRFVSQAVKELGLAVWLLLLASCASNEAPGQGEGVTTGDGDGDGDATSRESVSFDLESSLSLSPSGVASLKVVVVPSRGQTVTFELLSDEEPFDGFLTANSVQVDESGAANVELHAPTKPMEFVVRASLNSGAEARTTVKVDDQGTGSVVVTPKYAGARDIEHWYASVWPGVSCDDVHSWFDDSELNGRSEPNDDGEDEIMLAFVPAGTLFSVSVRGDQLAGACQTVMDLSTEEELTLTIPAVDRPINANSGILELSFGVDSATAEFETVLESAIDRSLASFVGEHESDASALLHGLIEQLPSDSQSAFTESLAEGSLLDEVEAHLTSPSAISDEIRSILFAASAQMRGDDVFMAELSLRGLQSELSLLTVGGVGAASAGFETPSDFQVEIETGDTVSLGGELVYNPIHWLASLAEKPEEGRVSPVDALEAVSQCDDVAHSLFAAAAESELGECDETCLFEACQSRAATIWETVKSSSDETGRLLIGASGGATIAGEAEIDSLLGTWVGKSGDTTASLKGTVAGQRK